MKDCVKAVKSLEENLNDLAKPATEIVTRLQKSLDP